MQEVDESQVKPETIDAVDEPEQLASETEALTEAEPANIDEGVAVEAVPIDTEWLNLDLLVVSDPHMPGPANPSSDGKTLAYLQEDLEGEIKLWICPIDGGSIQGVTLPFRAIIDPEGPLWSPDGQTIALQGWRPDGNGETIWLHDVESGENRLLTPNVGMLSAGRWSPDGSQIAFIARTTGGSAVGIAAVDGSGTVQQLTAPLPGQMDVDPVWSNDGSRIGFRRLMVDGETAGDHIWTVAVSNGELKQATKKIGNRRDLQWMSSRDQIAYVADETEWENIAVVNPDNQSSWNLASESGDKRDPRFSADGSRMLYTKTFQGSTRLCERGTSGASADALDPGDGEASAGRWMPDKHVVYRFTPATGETRFIVQAAVKDAERQQIFPAIAWEAPDHLVQPVHSDVETTSGLKLGAWIYRPAGAVGKRPAVLYLGDAPHQRQSSGYRPIEQALSAAGFVVMAVSMAGTSGYGKKITNALRNASSAETTTTELLDAIAYLRGLEGVDEDHVAIAGRGFGGGLALLTAGSRPGAVQAVGAIDPVTDLAVEFISSDDAWKSWQLKNLGLPVASKGRLVMRSPLTFAGTIDAPLLIVSTGARASQAAAMSDALNRDEVDFIHEEAAGESQWELANRLARFLRSALDSPAS